MPPKEIGCKLGLEEYLKHCRAGGRKPEILEYLEGRSEWMRDIVCLLDTLGILEPWTAWRPGACEPVVFVRQDLAVPAATIVDGKVVPGEILAVPLCSTLLDGALMVDELRIEPLNLTAQESGAVLPKKVNLGGFGEFCLPFEPDDRLGRFVNVEHFGMCSNASLSIFAQNFDPFSVGRVKVTVRMWGSCILSNRPRLPSGHAKMGVKTVSRSRR